MSAGPPRKPPGPPPGPGARPDGSQIVRGVGNVAPRAAPGPPPSAGGVSQLKPPPMAPPPRTMTPNMQRPPVESSAVRQIAVPRGPPPRGMMGTPRGPPPPRGAPQSAGVEFNPEQSMGGTGTFGNAMADPKFGASSKPQTISNAGRKAGAISMFNPDAPPPQEPSDSKVGTPQPGAGQRAPRPLPPRPQPPGIPSGQPMPPTQEPKKESKPPAPSKPAPDRNRAPPPLEPVTPPKERMHQPDAPPAKDAPFKRGLKPKEEEVIILKRREKEHPEFESSSDEEDVPGDKMATKKAKVEDPGTPLPITAGAVEDKPKTAEEKQVAIVPSKPDAIHDDDDGFEYIDEPQDIETNELGSDVQSVAETFDNNSYVLENEDDSVVAPMASGMPPSQGMMGTTVSNYVPPPPGEFIPQLIDSTLARDLTTGRFSVRLVEGFDIKRQEDKTAAPRVDPFVKIRLGVAERFPWKQSSTKRKQDTNPQFDGEQIYFDMTNPGQYIFMDDVQVTIEVWNKSAFKDEIIGAVTMSIVRILKSPYVICNETIPLYYPGHKTASSKLSVSFVFEEARPGMFAITLYEANGLRSVDTIGHQSPYVHFQLGDSTYVKKSAVIKNGNSSPYFAEEEVLLWIDSENWVNNLNIHVCDETVAMDKPIGSTHLSLLPYMNQKENDDTVEEYDLFYTVQIDPRDDREKKEISCGNIRMRIKYFQAGTLTVTCGKAKNIKFPENYVAPKGDDRLDPYCALTVEGQSVKMIKRSPVDKDGGADPEWEHDIRFDIVDQYLMDFEVYHQNMLGVDVLLGYTQISLLPIYRNGSSSFWVAMKQVKANGGINEQGAVYVTCNFQAKPGIAFPQHRTGVDKFDDTVRKLPELKADVEEVEIIDVKPEISTIPEEPVKGAPPKQIHSLQDAEQDRPPAEFSEEEVINAFKFIDLDHNNFVGASEIRHILVCMGEMITDEEIDMMISMVDMDGDGQVSFQEFRTLVLHPNPGDIDMKKEISVVRQNDDQMEKQAMAGKHVGLDLTAFQRQKEMLQREARKKTMVTFVGENDVDFDYLKHAYSRYLTVPKEKRKGGRIRFEEFCQVLDVEPISEYKNMHSLFDTEETNDMDFREFVLSMLNFVEIDREIRIRFSFQMFDEGKTGFISIKEVEEILRGNHMIGLASVQRKAQTIMKQASTNSTGCITSNEFVVVSKKFPNILLPVFHTAGKHRLIVYVPYSMFCSTSICTTTRSSGHQMQCETGPSCPNSGSIVMCMCRLTIMKKIRTHCEQWAI